jgi:hypothetical protein
MCFISCDGLNAVVLLVTILRNNTNRYQFQLTAKKTQWFYYGKLILGLANGIASLLLV